MVSPRRTATLALALALGIPLAAVTVTSVQAVPAYSGPYVRDAVTLGGGTGTALGVATLNDDTVFVASSLSNGSGVLDIIDNPGDNVMPNDDSLTFSSGVLGVAANQADDTAYFVTDSSPGPSGVTWTSQLSAADEGWVAVNWGGPTGQETFVAVADSGGTSRIMTSPDGITWTARTPPANNAWRSVAWGGPAGQKVFVAVAYSGTGNRVMTSPDGITWTIQASAADNDWRSVTWGGPAGQQKFVAVANSGTGNRVMTSPDGINWTTQTSAADNDWRWVTWGGPAGQQKFVAVAESGTGNRVMTSTDGINWTTQTSAADNPWRGVTWGGPPGEEVFVAVANGGTGNRVMTSPDGINWNTRASAADNLWWAVTWGGPVGQERFVAVASSGTGNRVMTSPDGINWTIQTSATDNDWRSVAWGGPAGQQKFVAVAFSGSGNRVMTSTSAPAPAGGRATLRTYARGALDDSSPMPGTGVGGDWAAVAVNNADDTVYVASQDDTRLYSFNGANLDDSRGIPLLASLTPRAVAVDQDDDTVYVLSSDIASGTSRITAMRGSNLDDSISVNFGMTTYLQSLAVNQVDGSIYVGGRDDTTNRAQVRVFTPGLIAASARTINEVDPVMGLDVSPDGRRLYATTSGGDLYLLNTANLDDSASVALGFSDLGGVAIDDFGWGWTANSGSMAGSRSLIQIGTAPTFSSITPTGGRPAGGYTATITGSWFTPTTTAAFDVEANVATTIGTPGSNSMTVTVPPGAAGTVDLILTNVAGPSQPLGIDDAGSFTYANPAPPPPVFPASAPRDVVAVAHDASATVTWSAPATPGSFPISSYVVTSAPDGKTCVTSTLTCEVTGLTNGTTYTFTVKALNEAGSSAASSPSNAVTPAAPPAPTIVISGTREGALIRITGTTTRLAGTVTPWVKFPGQMTYAAGTARPAIIDDGFTWSRRANKKTYVYFTHEAVKSNTVTIAAR